MNKSLRGKGNKKIIFTSDEIEEKANLKNKMKEKKRHLQVQSYKETKEKDRYIENKKREITKEKGSENSDFINENSEMKDDEEKDKNNKIKKKIKKLNLRKSEKIKDNKKNCQGEEVLCDKNENNILNKDKIFTKFSCLRRIILESEEDENVVHKKIKNVDEDAVKEDDEVLCKSRKLISEQDSDYKKKDLENGLDIRRERNENEKKRQLNKEANFFSLCIEKKEIKKNKNSCKYRVRRRWKKLKESEDSERSNDKKSIITGMINMDDKLFGNDECRNLEKNDNQRKKKTKNFKGFEKTDSKKKEKKRETKNKEEETESKEELSIIDSDCSLYSKEYSVSLRTYKKALKKEKNINKIDILYNNNTNFYLTEDSCFSESCSSMSCSFLEEKRKFNLKKYKYIYTPYKLLPKVKDILIKIKENKEKKTNFIKKNKNERALENVLRKLRGEEEFTDQSTLSSSSELYKKADKYFTKEKIKNYDESFNSLFPLDFSILTPINRCYHNYYLNILNENQQKRIKLLEKKKCLCLYIEENEIPLEQKKSYQDVYNRSYIECQESLKKEEGQMKKKMNSRKQENEGDSRDEEKEAGSRNEEKEGDRIEEEKEGDSRDEEKEEDSRDEKKERYSTEEFSDYEENCFNNKKEKQLDDKKILKRLHIDKEFEDVSFCMYGVLSKKNFAINCSCCFTNPKEKDNETLNSSELNNCKSGNYEISDKSKTEKQNSMSNKKDFNGKKFDFCINDFFNIEWKNIIVNFVLIVSQKEIKEVLNLRFLLKNSESKKYYCFAKKRKMKECCLSDDENNFFSSSENIKEQFKDNKNKHEVKCLNSLFYFLYLKVFCCRFNVNEDEKDEFDDFTYNNCCDYYTEILRHIKNLVKIEDLQNESKRKKKMYCTKKKNKTNSFLSDSAMNKNIYNSEDEEPCKDRGNNKKYKHFFNEQMKKNFYERDDETIKHVAQAMIIAIKFSNVLVLKALAKCFPYAIICKLAPYDLTPIHISTSSFACFSLLCGIWVKLERMSKKKKKEMNMEDVLIRKERNIIESNEKGKKKKIEKSKNKKPCLKDLSLFYALDVYERTPIYIAILFGSIQVLKCILSVDPLLLFTLDCYNATPLHFAALNNQEEALIVLLETLHTKYPYYLIKCCSKTYAENCKNFGFSQAFLNDEYETSSNESKNLFVKFYEKYFKSCDIKNDSFLFKNNFIPSKITDEIYDFTSKTQIRTEKSSIFSPYLFKRELKSTYDVFPVSASPIITSSVKIQKDSAHDLYNIRLFEQNILNKFFAKFEREIENVIEDVTYYFLDWKAFQTNITCLHIASLKGYTNVCRLLVAVGFPSLFCENDLKGRSAAQYSVYRKHIDTLELLLTPPYVHTDDFVSKDIGILQFNNSDEYLLKNVFLDAYEYIKCLPDVKAKLIAINQYIYYLKKNESFVSKEKVEERDNNNAEKASEMDFAKKKKEFN